MRKGDVLKASVWNQGRSEMPRYTALETVLIEHPDFENTEALCAEIGAGALHVAVEIQAYLSTQSE